MFIYFPNIIDVTQVRSVLDPCEDENGDVPEDEVSLGADSVLDDDSSSSDSEVKTVFSPVEPISVGGSNCYYF